MKNIKVVGFDADDTLWVNENYFREAEERFCQMLTDFHSKKEVLKTLFDIEMKNLDLYGFGIKGFMLSMMETINEVAGDKAKPEYYERAIALGKDMLNKPVQLLDEVEEILIKIQDKYQIILVTKGDLLDQQRKLQKSGLEKYFHHVEVMSNKHQADYNKLINHLDIKPHEFLMIGNSLRSDILPVIKVGSQAIYVPYEITWQHEVVNHEEEERADYLRVNSLQEIIPHLV